RTRCIQLFSESEGSDDPPNRNSITFSHSLGRLEPLVIRFGSPNSGRWSVHHVKRRLDCSKAAARELRRPAKSGRSPSPQSGPSGAHRHLPTEGSRSALPKPRPSARLRRLNVPKRDSIFCRFAAIDESALVTPRGESSAFSVANGVASAMSLESRGL